MTLPKNLSKIFSQRKKIILISLCIALAILIPVTLKTSLDQQPPHSTTSTTLTTSPTPPLLPGKHYVIGQVMAKFKNNIPQSTIDEKLQKYNAKVIEQIEPISVAVLEVPVGKEQEIIEKLTQDNIVLYAEPNYIYEDYAWTPNDPQFTDQWALKKIQASQAWDITRGAGITIAIIEEDGGDLSHPDLAANNATPGSDTGSDEHGTEVAGCIAAVTNNNQGISGTCPECKILMFNVPSTTDATVSKAITTAADKGAKAINMSFGGPNGGQTLIDAIDYGWNKGLISVAAAGNEGSGSFQPIPAKLPKVLPVGSTTSSDSKSDFSNFGTWVKITAPGSDILTTSTDGDYSTVSGTSFSAPITAGVIGLIWSTSHGTSAQAVVDRLCNTADKIYGTGSLFSCGRVNAFKAVEGTTNPNPPTTPSSTLIQSPPPTAPPQSNSPQIPPPTSMIATPTFSCLGSCPSPNDTPLLSQLPQPPNINQPGIELPEEQKGLLQLLIDIISILIQLLFRLLL